MSKCSRIPRDWLCLALLAAASPTFVPAARAGDLLRTWQVGETPLPRGAEVLVILNVLNLSSSSLHWTFPAQVSAQIRGSGESRPVSLRLAQPAQSDTIAPQGFVRAAYLLTLPETCEGETWLLPEDSPGSAVILKIQASPTPTTNATTANPMVPSSEPEARPAPPGKTDGFDPIDYFKRHLFPHEPFYFVAGPDSPNAKFQFSFKYQLVDDRSGFAEHAGFMTNLFFGFTQTSLWDWNKPSAPFEDSSYRPELMFQFSRLVQGGADDWFRLDLQTGMMHESNGRDGANSRSLNLIYLRPQVILGHDDDWQFTLASRVWVYVGDLSDNPDIARYRGHADLRATLGTPWGVELAACSRFGDNFDRGNLQLDLTIPLRRIRWTGFTWYLQAQYFTGYGESLLHYADRSEAWRIGFAIYR